jgi:wobble nucleotide-excising tRNase
MAAVKAKVKKSKSGTKEGVEEKRAKNTRKKVNEEAMLEWRAKKEALKDQAMDFYRQLKERNLPHFDGASIDFHRKRDPVVFIPGENPIITAVRKEELDGLLEGKRRPQSPCRCAVSEPCADFN